MLSPLNVAYLRNISKGQVGLPVLATALVAPDPYWSDLLLGIKREKYVSLKTMSHHLRLHSSLNHKKTAKATRQKQTSLMSGKVASTPANLLTRACRCSGQIGSVFLVETELAENLLQPSKTALNKTTVAWITDAIRATCMEKINTVKRRIYSRKWVTRLE